MKRNHVSKLVTILAMVASCQAGQVTHTGETGPGSLRYEITAAAADKTITFAPALDGATIVLDHGPAGSAACPTATLPTNRRPLTTPVSRLASAW